MKKILFWLGYYNYGIDIIFIILTSLLFICVTPLYFLIEMLKVIFANDYEVSYISFNYKIVWKRIFDL